MKKKFKIPLIIIVLLIILIAILLITLNVIKKEEDSTVKVVDSIKDFSYTLDDRDSKLMKETYKELKGVLSEKKVDYESYAKYLSELFVIDLFTMNNKTNKYDVGGSEYVYPNSIENYKINVEDTLYKTMENNSNGKRKQTLPIVKSIETSEIKTGEFIIAEETYESYIVSLTWDYEEDLGYDEFAKITLIKQNNRLYVVEYVTGE